jgi:hypothetical protein
LVATSSSGLPVTISSANGTCTISTSFVLTFVSPGACVLSASQSGGPGYLAAPSVTKSISLVAKTQTISFAPPTSLTIDQSPYTLVATSSSGLPVTVTSSSATVCSVAGFVLTLLSAGTCSLSATQSGGSGFSVANSVSKSISVTSKPETISFSPPTSLTIDQSPYTLVATSSSGLPVRVISSTPNVCTVSGLVLTVVSSGACGLSASQSGGSGFSVSKSISIPSKPQTISFSPPSSLTMDQSPYTLGATSSSGLPVTVTSSTASVCTVSRLVLTILSSGTCGLSATQSGGSGFAAATSVNKSISVALKTQTISFSPPSSLTLDQSPYTLVATSSSGLPVTVTSSTASVCTVSGLILTIVSSGTCGLSATQAGGSGFAAATGMYIPITVLGRSDSVQLKIGTLESGATYRASQLFSTFSGRLVFVDFSESRNCVSNGSLNQVEAFDPGYCTIGVSVRAIPGWEALSTSIRVKIALPKITVTSNGVWAMSGSTSNGITSKLTPGTISLSPKGETRRMTLAGYYSCPVGTNLTSDRLATGCVLVGSVADGLFWRSLTSASGMSTSSGSYFHMFSSPRYAVEVGDGYELKGTQTPLHRLYNYVRWTYLDDKSVPSAIAPPSLTRPLATSNQLELNVGSWSGTATSDFLIAETYIEWGYCKKGTVLPSSACYTLQSLSKSGSTVIRILTPSLLEGSAWQIYAFIRALNSFGYSNYYVTWSATT